MVIGSFGEVVFSVSPDKIQTIRDLTRQGSASIQSHKRHLNTDLPEFTGTDLESVTFRIRLSKYLGTADPARELDRLADYMRRGIPKYLTLGTGTVGQYKWLIAKYQVTHEHFDGSGNPVTLDVAVTLTEYPKS